MKDTTQNHVTGSIPSWLAGELPAAAKADLEAHLAGCPACALACAEARELWEQLGQVPSAVRVPSTSVWPAVRRRTVGRRDQAPWFFGTGRLVRSSLATAAVCAGLLMGVLMPGGASDQVGGTAGAQTTSVGQTETAWLSGSSWDSGLTDFETVWLAADLVAESSPGSTAPTDTIAGEGNR